MNTPIPVKSHAKYTSGPIGALCGSPGKTGCTFRSAAVLQKVATLLPGLLWEISSGGHIIESSSQFQAKLREKRQTDLQIRQASHAVSLYWDVQKALKARPMAFAAAPLSKATEAAKLYRLPAELPKKQIQGKERGSQVPTVAQAPWDRAISQLIAVIKTRHYSPKTLKSYSHWARKLQSFKRDREPSSLTSEYVKEFLTYLAV